MEQNQELKNLFESDEYGNVNCLFENEEDRKTCRNCYNCINCKCCYNCHDCYECDHSMGLSHCILCTLSAYCDHSIYLHEEICKTNILKDGPEFSRVKREIINKLSNNTIYKL